MKKIILSVLFAISSIALVNAQDNAIGLRLNAGDGTGFEASYQRYLNDAHRLEIDLGIDTDDFIHVSALYQWVWDLSVLADGFNWYAGVGGGAFFGNHFTGIGVIGDVGIEYNFNIPLQLSLDLRPGFYFTSAKVLNETVTDSDFGWGGVALSVRYKF